MPQVQFFERPRLNRATASETRLQAALLIVKHCRHSIFARWVRFGTFAQHVGFVCGNFTKLLGKLSPAALLVEGKREICPPAAPRHGARAGSCLFLRLLSPCSEGRGIPFSAARSNG